MRFISALILFLITTSVFSFQITKNGDANAVIVLDKTATKQEVFAADEFQKYIKEISGANLSIVNDMDKSRVNIFIGQTDATKKVYNMDWDTLKYDGICIVTQGNNLIIAGDRPRGTIYAVYEFLEKYLGCRWYTSTVSKIPKKATINVKKIDYKYVPEFRYREVYSAPALNDPNFSIKHKLNGHYNNIPEDKGGHYYIIGFCHTFDQFVPYNVYGQEHPEWYSYIDGRRQKGYVQLCLSNPEVIKKLTEVALEKCRENPQSGYISISQNDNMSYCQCDKCNELAKKYGGQSGVLLWAVNQVAKEVKKEFPDFMVETLAYQYTRQAPKNIVPDDNVLTRLCTIECDFSKPLTAKENQSFCKDLMEWKAISKNLFIWNYICDFANYHVAHPTVLTLKPDVELFRNSNVKGIFEQSDCYNEEASFNKTKSYLASKLIWNSNLNPIATIKEFNNAYYGKAAGKYMTDFILFTEGLARKSTVPMGFAANNNSFISVDEMIKGFKMLRKAYDVTINDSVYNKRVLAQFLGFQTAWMSKNTSDRKIIAEKANLLYSDVNNFIPAYYKLCNEVGNTRFSEGTSLDASIFAIDFSKTNSKSYSKPKEVQGIKDEDWFEFQETAFRLNAVGTYSIIEADNKASDNMTLKLTNDNVNWNIQCDMADAALRGFENVDIYADIRVDPGKEKGNVLEYGFYSGVLGERKYIGDINDGDYHTVYLGKYKISANEYLYMAPLNNPNVCENIYVDRIFMVKSK